MTSTIVKGMAYVTMEYEGLAGMLPTIASSIAFGDAPIVDQTSTMKCTGSKILAQSELQLHFAESNFTWMVFFSEPVWLTCYSSEDTKQAMIQVVSTLNEDNSNNTKPLIVRAALLDSCSNGKNSAGCKVGLGGAPRKSPILRNMQTFFADTLGSTLDEILRFRWKSKMNPHKLPLHSIGMSKRCLTIHNSTTH